MIFQSKLKNKSLRYFYVKTSAAKIYPLENIQFNEKKIDLTCFPSTSMSAT